MNSVRTQSLPPERDQAGRPAAPAHAPLWRRITALFSTTANASSIDDARIADMEGRVKALDRVQAVIEFDLDGTILHANDNFLHALGYRLDDIQGHHHRMFV